MKKHNRFERTGKGTVFACETCGRNTRMAGQGNDTLCPECWELAGIDNHVNDNGSEALTAGVVAERDALLRKAVARGGNEDAIRASNAYLWPTTKKPRVGFHTGLTGDGVDIPDFCLVKNRKPLTAEQQAKLDTQTVKQQPERVDGRKPKGMSWEDWDAYLQGNNKGNGSEPALAVAKPRGMRKAGGLLDANYFAPLCGCEPKVVRRALRSQPKPFAVAKPASGWYFPKEQEAAVIAVVKAYLGKRSKAATPPAATPTPEPIKPRKAVSADPKVDAALRAAFSKGAAKREAKGLPPTKAKRARK
jgi:hypothetical protein